jgi:hypothetical protein
VDPFQSNVPFVPIDTAFPDGSTYNSSMPTWVSVTSSARASARAAVTRITRNNAWSGTATTTYGAHSGRGGVTVDLGKGFSARAGYAYTGGGLGLINGVTPAYSGHSFDGGVSYSNAISLSSALVSVVFHVDDHHLRPEREYAFLRGWHGDVHVRDRPKLGYGRALQPRRRYVPDPGSADFF